VARGIARGWAFLFPNPGFYGWAVVGLCLMCAMLSSPGQSFALSLYLEHLIADLGLSRMALSSLYGAMTLTAAATLPLVGRLADRFDGRYFLACVIVGIGAACLFFSQVTTWIGVAVAFFLLRLLGQGAIGLGNLTVVVRWFRQFRGRALAVVNLGYATGEMIFPTLILGLIAAIGWRGSMMTFAAVYVLVFAPLVLWLLRPRTAEEPFDGEPETEVGVGDEVDEEITDEEADAPPGIDPEEHVDAVADYTFGQALKTPKFWVMALCVSVLPMVVTAVIFHQVALFASLGWAKSLIAPAFVGFAAARVGTTYGTGFVLEHVSSRFGVSAAMVLATLALVSTVLPVSGAVGSMIYGAGLGAATGGLSTSNQVLWPEYFGTEAVGQIKGAVTAIRNASTAAGPPLVAWLIAGHQQFDTAIAVLVGLCVLAAVVAPWVTPPRR
jgi:sugar phosphate permease